jgi:hypothetical protein
VVVVVVVGLAVGSLTSFGQGHLDGALDAFVNSASAWLVAPFVIGMWMTTRRGAAVAGMSVCSLQLVGYYATAHLRGFSAGGAIVAFWAACAVVGGPVFGVGGRLSRGAGRLRALGAAVLPAAFVAEGLWVYVHELHYYATAALWIGIGAALAVVMLRGRRELRWLVVALVVGLAAELLLSQIYRQSF